MRLLICSVGPFTCTVKAQVEWFPAASSAVQATIVSPRAKVLPLAGLLVTPASEQLSDAAGAKLTTAPEREVASVTMLPGQVMTGGVASNTVTVATQLSNAPSLSVTVNVTLVSPSGYGPEGDWDSVIVPALRENEPSSMEASPLQLAPADTVAFLHRAAGGSPANDRLNTVTMTE